MDLIFSCHASIIVRFRSLYQLTSADRRVAAALFPKQIEMRSKRFCSLLWRTATYSTRLWLDRSLQWIRQFRIRQSPGMSLKYCLDVRRYHGDFRDFHQVAAVGRKQACGAIVQAEGELVGRLRQI